MNKNYIKPSITVVEMEIESLLNTFSQEGKPEGDGITPGGDPVTGGDADAKHNGGNSLWDDTDW
ncbi:hypothetical protein [Xylanibacter muris]|uniref:Benenodin family lasso peptide n=1 Tax=Xylanibacter muris TaxID=2736290 RepID=A0ABX2APH1_9BACT|nr:hypothetical protein [Xylanibacter muris]NPD92874.1 hypothetical protein [Xylanibacter muris]